MLEKILQLLGWRRESSPVQCGYRQQPPAVAGNTANEDSLALVLDIALMREKHVRRYDPEHPPGLGKEVLQRLNDHIQKIPPMPEIWHDIQAILEDEDATTQMLADCLARDPTLTAKILGTCNSAAYLKQGAEITSLHLAITRLGMNEVAAIAFQTLVPSITSDAMRQKHVRYFWFHAQAIALLTKIISDSSACVGRRDAPVLGMLHDIGKLVMIHMEPLDVLEQLREEIAIGKDALQAEQEVLGYTHVDAGMILALRWKLPKIIRKTIGYHHYPGKLPLEKTPSELRQMLVALHASHIVLDHYMEKGELGMTDYIWGGAAREHRRDIADYIRSHLDFPLQSHVLLTRMEKDCAHISMSFADIFPPSR